MVFWFSLATKGRSNEKTKKPKKLVINKIVNKSNIYGYLYNIYKVLYNKGKNGFFVF